MTILILRLQLDLSRYLVYKMILIKFNILYVLLITYFIIDWHLFFIIVLYFVYFDLLGYFLVIKTIV